jgi:hypothetical protein
MDSSRSGHTRTPWVARESHKGETGWMVVNTDDYGLRRLVYYCVPIDVRYQPWLTYSYTGWSVFRISKKLCKWTYNPALLSSYVELRVKVPQVSAGIAVLARVQAASSSNWTRSPALPVKPSGYKQWILTEEHTHRDIWHSPNWTMVADSASLRQQHGWQG